MLGKTRLQLGDETQRAIASALLSQEQALAHGRHPSGVERLRLLRGNGVIGFHTVSVFTAEQPLAQLALQLLAICLAQPTTLQAGQFIAIGLVVLLPAALAPLLIEQALYGVGS